MTYLYAWLLVFYIGDEQVAIVYYPTEKLCEEQKAKVNKVVKEEQSVECVKAQFEPSKKGIL
jgi:hypothetical protein